MLKIKSFSLHISWGLGIAFCAIVILFAGYGVMLQAHSDISLTQASSTPSMHLIIPKIGVDAVVENVGLTPTGAMDVPKDPAGVAWFDLGPRPGESGTAVIDGHFGWKNNIPAVFDNLYTLQKGDKIYIEDTSGKIVTFVVRESRNYDPKADASSVFGSNDGKAHLNLITCEGSWNADKKSYSNRLVVFADKE